MTAMTDTPQTTRSNSIVASIVVTINALCAIVPYAVVAVGLRLLMARVFFLSGQTRIDGPGIPISTNGFLNYPITLPAELKASTFQTFASQYGALPIPTNVSAYLFTYAEFILPVLLVIGFATRISATILFAMTFAVAYYVAPGALWTTHIYVFAILLVLMSAGPGAISLDHLIRYLNNR